MTATTTETHDERVEAAAQAECDLIMKGGVTSGLVYPRAVRELAQVFRFRSIGGTSAGAIAAAAAAAAEYGRQHPAAGRDVDPFDALGAMPTELAQPGRLLALFRPTDEHRGLFDLAQKVATASGGDASLGQVVRKVLGVRARPWLLAILGLAVLGALVGAVLGNSFGVLGFGAVGTGALVGALLGGVLAIRHAACTTRVLLAHLASLPERGFGLSLGLSAPSDKEAPALTPWLADLIDQLAGLAPGAAPLTFGQLWGEHKGVPRKPRSDTPGAPAPNIDLRMVTTCVTLGRPVHFPLHDSLKKDFYFCPSELRRWFPDRIVDHLVAHAQELGRPVVMEDGVPLLRMPLSQDIPIVFAARLSLSFPLLLAAVPLHAVDYDRKGNRTDEGLPGAPRIAERVWFSDGGLSSNLPIRMFDRVVPGRPTLAIDLEDTPPTRNHRADEPVVFRGGRAGVGGGASKRWQRIDLGSGLGSVARFLACVFYTAKDWRDTTLAGAVGYYDRVVCVRQAPGEGGLNLAMPAHMIESLANRGAAAGRALVERFGPEDGDEAEAFTHHRWLRLRVALRQMEALLMDFEGRVERGQPSFAAMLRDGGVPCAPGYRLSDTQLEHLSPVVADLRAVLARWKPAWEAEGRSFQHGAPKPLFDTEFVPPN